MLEYARAIIGTLRDRSPWLGLVDSMPAWCPDGPLLRWDISGESPLHDDSECTPP